MLLPIVFWNICKKANWQTHFYHWTGMHIRDSIFYHLICFRGTLLYSMYVHFYYCIHYLFSYIPHLLFQSFGTDNMLFGNGLHDGICNNYYFGQNFSVNNRHPVGFNRCVSPAGSRSILQAIAAWNHFTYMEINWQKNTRGSHRQGILDSVYHFSYYHIFPCRNRGRSGFTP